jgi:hypothetical protein
MPVRALKHIVPAIFTLIFISTPLFCEPSIKWPRAFERNGRVLIVHQPQIDRWDDFETLEAKLVVELIPKKGAKPLLGAALLSAQTEVDHRLRLVRPYNVTVQGVNFPYLPERLSERLSDRLTGLMPVEFPPVSLDLVLANIKGTGASPRTLKVEAEPPNIIVSHENAALVQIYGDPVLSAVEGTDLVHVINSSWPLFLKAGASEYYLLIDDVWLTSTSLGGPWSRVLSLPKSFASIPKTGKWEEIAKKTPPPADTSQKIPKAHVVTEPSELIQIKGEPKLTPIDDLNLSYVENCDSDLFFNHDDSSFYYLVSGRWFKAPDLQGPWTNVTGRAPSKFSSIPQDHPKARVLVSIPGTEQARVAVLEAQVPRKASIVRGEVSFSATYNGDPIFAPIEGTLLYYAVNTPNDIIQYEDKYYACENGIWFEADSPVGPWELCQSLPDEIYEIPPNSSKHHVTYVHIYGVDEEMVTVGYTAGYEGVYIQDGVVVYGAGYFYPAYVWNAGLYHPVYYPPAYKTYGYGAFYNPYTGRFIAGSAIYGPYAVKFSRGFYNPVTGAWGATHQYNSPYASWGRSVITGTDESNRTRAGKAGGPGRSMAGLETPGGTRAEPDHEAGVVKRSRGDLYVGKDGNIYKNTRQGWGKYEGKGKWARLKVERAAAPSDSTHEGRDPDKARIGSLLRQRLMERSARQGAGIKSPDRVSAKSLERDSIRSGLIRDLERDFRARAFGERRAVKMRSMEARPNDLGGMRLKTPGHGPAPVKNAPRGRLRRQ